jgi:integrase
VDGIAVADAVRAGACVPRDAGPQAAALYAFGLDTGARKGEICGLRWTNLDLESGHAHIVEQLTKPGPHPVFGPPKNGKPRNVTLASDTVELLRAHKKHQALFRMKEPDHLSRLRAGLREGVGRRPDRKDCLGQPLQANNRLVRSLTKFGGQSVGN